ERQPGHHKSPCASSVSSCTNRATLSLSVTPPPAAPAWATVSVKVVVRFAQEVTMRTRSSFASSSAEQFKYPDWQGLYHAAVLETNRQKLLKSIQAAESAMLKRLQAL